MRTRWLLLTANAVVCAAISGCSSEEPSIAADECGADGYASLIGTAIAAATLPAELNYRVIGPDTVVTQDFLPERLNIYTDADGVVTELKCG
ncbi:MAG: I78 family peptidase inhibitor [Pseudomonadota bacterium]